MLTLGRAASLGALATTIARAPPITTEVRARDPGRVAVEVDTGARTKPSVHLDERPDDDAGPIPLPGLLILLFHVPVSTRSASRSWRPAPGYDRPLLPP
jgi:hypothetical protein